jgi:hypothetical protein
VNRLLQIGIEESGLDVELLKLKVVNCGVRDESPKRVEATSGHERLGVIYSLSLRETLRAKAGLELRIPIRRSELDAKHPGGPHSFDDGRQIHNIPDTETSHGGQLLVNCFFPTNGVGPSDGCMIVGRDRVLSTHDQGTRTSRVRNCQAT